MTKGDEWFFGMRFHTGVDAASGLFPSGISTAANWHELNIADGRLHGDETVIERVSVHLGIDKREIFEDSGCQFWIGMRLGQRRALPYTPEGRPEALMETAKPTCAPRRNMPFR